MPTDTANTIQQIKRAETDGSVHELIVNRWSPRAFSSQPVSTEDLKAMLEAARWAASSYNEQPWRFYISRKSSDPAAYKRLLDTLVPFNQAWVGKGDVLIIMAAKKTFTRNGQPNYYALHDAGQALAHLMLQATALGLHAHAMAGFDHERARAAIGLPEDYDVAAAVAIGYLDSPESLPEEMRAGELGKRERKPLSEIAFGSRFDEPLNL
jgi:nitroreductase